MGTAWIVGSRARPSCVGFSLMPEKPQQLFLIIEKFDAERIARTVKPDRYFGFHPPRMRRHHNDAIGEIDGFRDVVGDIDHRLACCTPDLCEKPLHLVAS